MSGGADAEAGVTGGGRLGVLGPVEAIGPGGPAELHGPRQRALVGVLALHAGTVLPASRLVDVLWGESPPRTAVKTLHSHIARIRTALAACGFGPIVRTRDPGYLLEVDLDAVDAHRFAAAVRTARAHLAGGAPERAAPLLRAAVGLWRGEPFADTALGGWGEREVADLGEQRLGALEDLWDAELRLGAHEDAVRELPRLLAAQPLRERLAGLYMLALHRCGRHTDALSAFAALRRGLAEEFGVDPGPELLDLHTAILRRDEALGLPEEVVGPVQIPAVVGHFTGRDDELSDLDAVLSEADLPVVVVAGAAGMGKTALAVQWAHRVGGRFPDGQLFVDLGGADRGRALTGVDALAHLLRALSVPDERIPADAGERAGLYRSLLRTRRCLIVVDNAANVDDVLPLVPGAGASLLVVTSRHTLAALGTRHAVRLVELDALEHNESVALLSKVLGERRVAREAGAAARLARLCGGMPLALRIAAARLQARPGGGLAESAAELQRAGRLDGLAVEGDARTVRAVLASAYQPLSPTGQRFLRLLGLAPGATMATGLGAALCASTPDAAAAAMADLAGAHLLVGAGRDRYRMHDLIREFAAARAAEDRDLPAAVDRMLTWYLGVAAAANRLIDPNRDVVSPVVDVVAPFPPERHAALAFLDAERDNLLPVVRMARDRGRPDIAWQLTYLVTSYHDATGHWQQRVELCRQGAAAAETSADPRARGEMLRALGVAYFMTRRFTEALETNQRALAAARAAGDLAGEGHVCNNIANAYAELRRFDEAVAAHRTAVACCAAAGHRLGEALSQRNLGHTFVRMGRADLGLPPLTAALATFTDLGHDRFAAATLDTLGEARRHLGEHTKALADIDRAVEISRTLGDRWLESECLLDAGRVHLDLGDPRTAAAHFDAALTASRAVGDRHGEAATLGELSRAHLAVGDHTAARIHLESALAVRAEVPDDVELAALHHTLAALSGRR
ncbi:BTAD domain-containing putative transcriptional regulator [Actinokineospora sp. 24-640]